MAIVVCIPAVLMSSPAAPASAAVANRIVKQNGFNGEVKSITEPDSNGIRYVGGRFTAFNSWDTGPGVVVNSTTAEVNVTFPKIAGSYATINAVANDGVGGFYIGGTFTSVDGQAITNAAHINADGSLDTAWDPAPNNNVTAIVVSGSTVYLGGSFTMVKGVTRNRAAAVSATTAALVSGWDPAPNNTVNALVVSGSTVYLGGSFTTVKGTTRNRAAAVDASTAALVSGWDPAPNGTVNALVVSGSTVYLGGSFTQVKATARNSVAAVDISTAGLSAWDPNTDGTVYSIAVSGSTVYLGGWFWYVNAYATGRQRAAAVDATSGIATSWDPSPNGRVNSLVVSGSTVFMAGGFTTVNGSVSRNSAAAVNTSSGSALTWNSTPRGTVNALAVSGSRVFMGGDFSTVGGTARNNAAAIDNSGGLTSWNPDVNAEVKSIVLSGSNVYMCGSFSMVGGIARAEAAIIGTDGTLRAFKPMAHGGSYTAIVPYGDYVYIATSYLTQHTYSNPGPGSYTGRNEVVSQGRGITKYNATINGQNTSNQGYVASPTSVNTSFSDRHYNVTQLLISGNTLYFAGDFGITSGTGRRNAAAVDLTTNNLLDWNPLANGAINVMGISGSTVYLGGDFTAIGGTWQFSYQVGNSAIQYNYVSGGTSRRYAAAVDATSGSLLAWNPNMSGVKSFLVSGNTLYVGGGFELIGGSGGSIRNRLAAFDVTSGSLLDWNPNVQGTSSSTSTSVGALSISGSSLMVGGSFGSINGSPRSGLAVVNTSTGAVAETPTPTAPVNSVAPTISGTAEIGQSLSVTDGSWTGSPTSYSYEWLWSSTVGGNYAPISGATSSTYVVSDPDAGTYLKVIVTANNAGGSTAVLTSATSLVPIPAPRNLSVPTISGTAIVGNTLTASSNGTWANSPTSYLLQWQRSESLSGTYYNISTATTSSHSIEVGDIGYYIRLSVIARSGAGDSIGAPSTASSSVVDIVPTNASVPVVTGTAQTGQTLSISNGSWNNRETSYAYQWTRSSTVDGTYLNISSATSAAYVIASTDVGYFIKGTVAGVNSGGTAAYASSTATAQVIDIAPVYSGPPVITGIAQTGQTLSVSNGSWDNRPTSYRYQWKRSETSDGTYANISGATTNSYPVTVDDLGWFIKAVVTGVNTGGDAGASAWSAATAASIDLLPVNTAIPVVTGTAQTGQILSVSNGSWDNRPITHRYQWTRSSTSDGTYTEIVGASNQTYVVDAGDVGYFVKATVAAVNSGGTTSYSSSTASSRVIDLAPVFVSAPAITGIAKSGQTLSVSNGLWSNRPTSFVYKWKRSTSSGSGFVDIVGASSATYEVLVGDAGYFITAVVRSTNTGGDSDRDGTAAATAQVTETLPTNSVVPVVVGTAQTGRSLNASTGSWSIPALTFSYQWMRATTVDGTYANIADATLSTYVVSHQNVGYFIKVVVTGVNTGGAASSSAASSATAIVIDVAPTSSATPSIIGTAQTGQTLTVSNETWNNRPTAYTYQWKRASTVAGPYSDIIGADTANYVVGAGDLGYFFKVAVTASNSGGTSSVIDSVVTAQSIDIAPVNATVPAITGTAQVGVTLSVSDGNWDNRPTSLTYQWKRSSTSDGTYSNITNATSASYVVTVGDIGYFIRGVVTGVNTGGSSSGAISAATAAVVDIAPVAATTSVISGIAQNGQTLTAATTNWVNRPTSFTYQWSRAASVGGAYADIVGATSATLVLTEGDVDYFFKVVVTASNSGGTSTGSTSAATSIVRDIAPVNTGTPVINGTVQVGEELAATRGLWASSPTSYAYQWKRANSASGTYSNIEGANSSSYTVTPDDVGKFLKVAVTATNSIGSSIPMLSAAKGPAIDIIATNLTLPTVSGTAKNAETLTAATGTWDNRPTSYTYQWKRATTATGTYSSISGETDRTYVMTDNDVDKFIKVSVTAINSGGSSSIATSTTAVGPIADLPSMTAPTVSDLSITRTTAGFTFQISNYSSTTAYSLTTTAGTVTLGDTGLATVIGLDSGESASVTVRVSRTGYRSASVIVVGSTIAPATTTTTSTTIAPGSTAVAVTTTTLKPALEPRMNVPTTTIAVVKSVNQPEVSTPPKKNSALPIATSTTVPALESAAPGAATATVDGKVVEAEVTRVENKIVASSGGVTAAVGVLNADGSTSALDTDGNVRIKPGQLFNLAVDGFAAGSTVDVWLFSTPRKLGELITAADGKVTATFEIPSDLKNGKHRLAFVGQGVGGKETTLVVGIVAGAEPKNWSSTRVLIVVPLVMAIFIALLLPGAFQRRRRKRLA